MDNQILTAPEIRRFQKHLILPGIGIEGQEKLKQARVLVIGAGGLGSPVLQYLTASGIGHIGIVDHDIVQEDNLQRQILYGGSDLGKLKSIVAKERLETHSPFTRFQVINIRVTTDNVARVVKDYDLVVDATDNMPTRYLIDQACQALHIPMVHGSIHKWEGQVSVFHYQGGPGIADLWGEEPGSNEVADPRESGVISVLPGIIGLLQANEVIKIVTGVGTVLSGTLLCVNLLDNVFEQYRFA